MGMRMERVDVTPGPAEVANIIRYIRHMHKEGQQAQAFKILSAGWPNMQAGNAIRLLNGEIELPEALDPYTE